MDRQRLITEDILYYSSQLIAIHKYLLEYKRQYEELYRRYKESCVYNIIEFDRRLREQNFALKVICKTCRNIIEVPTDNRIICQHCRNGAI